MNEIGLYKISGDLEKEGYLILKPKQSELFKEISCLRNLFEKFYQAKFNSNITRNRNLIKLFGEDIRVKQYFNHPDIITFIKHILGIEHPVHTGPVVSHYTGNDETGGGYGLEFHQDWPSMGTSTKSVICWINIKDTNNTTHGLTIIPGSHLGGLLPGEQTDKGYIVKNEFCTNTMNLNVEAGCLVFMSPWLVHKTFVNPQAYDYKLSLSARFDDLECESWSDRNFVSAYYTSVNREVWKT
jgi:ectoine hydroxylase-related dioxygenase (phytanoyl-CoA dioxygenase family)